MESWDDVEKPLLLVENASSPVLTHKSTHARDVHILSFAFLLIFLAFGAAQNLESSVNTVSAVWFTEKMPLKKLARIFFYLIE
jgi:hypothetical protein